MKAAKLIEEKAQGAINFKNSTYRGLSLTAVREIASSCFISVKEVEITALESAIIPERYVRSLGSVGGPSGQLKLLRSRVAVIGLGGLGGLVAELLSRMGVGTIVLVDGDCFSESNLNRQVMATEAVLGVQKATVVDTRIADVNGAVERIVFDQFATPESLRDMLAGCEVAVDCLDSIGSRFMLEDCCRKMKIPFVHGAIAQFYGQVAVIFPDDPGLEAIYGPQDNKRQQGIETELGNPATTPALVASLQVQETLKLLLKTGQLLRNCLLFIDTLYNSYETIPLGKRE